MRINGIIVSGNELYTDCKVDNDIYNLRERKSLLLFMCETVLYLTDREENQ